MNKEEILEMSRKSNRDEGMEHAENQGRKIGFIVFSALFVVLALFSLFFWQQSALYAVSALFWVFLATEAYAKYRFTRKNVYLVSMIAGYFTSACFIAQYILVVLRERL
jgi:hypothetical protein